MNGPDPMRECRPGGMCRECNPTPPICPWCGDAAVENEGDQCEACAELEAEKASEVLP